MVDFVTNWLQAFCNLIFLMTAIRKMILQITYFQDITDLTTDFCTSNDRFGFIALNQRHSHFGTLVSHFFGPDAGLNFADVRLVQQDEAQATLSDATAH